MEVEQVADQALLSAAHAGDEAAFEKLFARHYQKLFLAALRICGNREDAEEIALDSFVKLHQRRLEATPDANVIGWLYRTTTNAAFNRVRSRNRRFRWQDRFKILERSDKRTGEDPAKLVERDDTAARVRAVLLELPERERNLLMLRSAGLSYKELAEALDIRQSSVGTLLVRAEQKLRDRMIGEQESWENE